jgi:hypothetical protein
MCAAADRCESGDVVADAVEFTAWVRGTLQRCRWERGELTGDAELISRLGRFSPGQSWHADAASVARALRRAVPGPVTIRLVPERRSG